MREYKRECPDCRTYCLYDELQDVFYCVFCGWDEVLDEMEHA